MYDHHDNIDVRTDEVIAVDPAAPSVTFADGETLGADAVVLAAGARANFFHTLGADVHAYPLYSVEDAVRVRTRILQLFKDTAQRPELAARGSLTFVVVGGGPDRRGDGRRARRAGPRRDAAGRTPTCPPRTPR